MKLKSKKRRRAAKVFLWLGIIFLLVTAYVAFLHFFATGNNAPFEMANADYQKYVDSYSLEALLISGGVTLLLFIIALILAASARRRAKRESEEMYDMAEEYFVEPSVEVSVKVPATCAKDVKKAKRSLNEIKNTIVEKAKDEKVQKVGKIAVPIVAGCVVAAAIASAVGNGTKAKRRRQFYKWLG